MPFAERFEPGSHPGHLDSGGEWRPGRGGLHPAGPGVEGDRLRMIPIGLAEGWPGVLAFPLDGVQRSELVAYAGSAPIVVAEIAAAVRERRDRQLHTAVEARRMVASAGIGFGRRRRCAG